MKRSSVLWIFLTCALGGRGAAPAAMIGVELRTDSAWDGAATTLLGEDAHVVRLYAVFDGPAGPGDENVVLSAYDSTIATLEELAQFYQEGPPHGGHTAPNSDYFATYPTLEWDTFVSIGKLDSAGEGDSTALYPDFVMGSDSVLGGWYNSYPPNLQGAPDGDFAVFLAQFTVLGLPSEIDATAGPDLVIYNTVFAGELTVSHNSPAGPVEVDVIFEELIDCNGNSIPDHMDIAGGTSQDGNGNGVPDECEVCYCGDVNEDGLVDLADFSTFASCFWLSEPSVNCNSWRFNCMDLDADGFVDLVDYATFAVIYGLTMTFAPPHCLDWIR